MTMEQIRILLVEDDTDYALLLIQRLTSHREASMAHYHVAHVLTLQAAIAHVADQPVDIILLDLTLPGTSGLHTIERMQETSPAIAIIVLTAANDKLLTTQALQTGVEDYLIKGQFDKEMLGRAIRYALERKRSRNALLASKQRFRRLIEHASDMIAIVNAQLEITYITPAVQALLGYRPDELIGCHLSELVHSGDREMMQRAFAKAHQMPSDGLRPFTMRVQRVDGRWRTVSTTITDLLDDPLIQGIVLNTRDITEQQQAEAIMRQAQKLQSVGLIASSLAHDFNNMLTNIVAQNALALAKLPLGNPARAHIGKANSAVNMAANLTRQLMTYAGRGYTQVQATDINALILEKRALFEASLAQSIALDLDLAPALPTVDADHAQLQQAIMNLVINAAEAIYPNPGRITISTALISTAPTDLMASKEAVSLREGPFIVLKVSDTGRGMDGETKERIFEPFFSTKPHGHGLGLPATLGIMNACGGSMQVCSAVGDGTQIRLFFPPGRLQAQSGITYTQLDPPTTNTVLLINDEKLLLESLADLLGAAGLQTLTALSGKQGIELFRQYSDKIGVIMLDMKMPPMDGPETLRMLRALDPEVEIIITTTYDIPPEVYPLLDDDKTALVTKPFDVDQLLTRILHASIHHTHATSGD